MTNNNSSNKDNSPVDTRHRSNVYKGFKQRPRRRIDVL